MNKDVHAEIGNRNPWYTSSQLDWAKQAGSMRIYEKRHEFFYKTIKRCIQRKGQVRLLDYGCGDGYWASRLSVIENCSVTGVDYNPLRIERARAMAPKAVFLEADLSRDQLELGLFDIVLCSQVIEHVPDDELFLTRLRRFLSDDGCLVLGTPNEGCFIQRLRNRLVKEETDHCHFYVEREIREKLGRAGFTVKEVFREVFYPGHDRLYYALTSFSAGFKFLELCTKVMPSQCSDYYFACEVAH
jgi:2-polyprenyl-3-methyl-5-hydroxy-6-metoxy-1,4-benzoquinol methylase